MAPTSPRAPRAPIAPSAPKTAENLKTVREIIPPWDVLQQQMADRKATSIPPEQGAAEALAKQEAANASWAPPASKRQTSSTREKIERAPYTPEDSVQVPASGIRMSEPAPEPNPEYAVPANEEAELAHDLSFKVYTLAQLERRSDAPVSIRSSRAGEDLTSSRSGGRHWQRAFAAFVVFAKASIAWLKIKGLRPSPKVALRKEFDALGDELQGVVESIDWRTLGIRTGIVVGATLTLLFAVLTAAELTDDLKPPGSASVSHLASSETSVPGGRTPLDTHGVAPATNMAAQGLQLVAAPPPPSAEPEAAMEIDDEPTAPAAKKAARKPAAKKKDSKLTIRNPDFLK